MALLTKHFRIKWMLVLTLGYLPVFLVGQPSNLGRPFVRNFSKTDYRAGTQNWQIAQSPTGVVYVANNEGLLEFDGSQWQLYQIANGTSVRSVAFGKDGKIYVGGQGEIGYFESNQKGQLVYKSLNDHFPNGGLKFEDVWDIVVSEDAVYFMSWKMIIKWSEGKITVPLPEEGFLLLEKIGDRFFVQKADFQVGYFNKNLSGTFQIVAAFPHPITSILPISEQSLLLTTDKHGIFQWNGNTVSPWPTQNDLFFRENRIYSSAQLPNGSLVFGTVSAGMLVMDKNRRIIQQASKDSKLQNNTVLSVLPDQKGNVWLGLDNGVSFVHTNAAFTEFFPDGDLEGTCYAATIHNGYLYTGTNTGIYSIPWQPYYLPSEKKDFKLVKRSEGQVWSLERFGNHLLAGHQNGPMVITGTTSSQIADLLGVWRFIPTENDRLVAGHYGGLSLFRQQQSGVTYIGPLTGLQESCRLLGYNGNGMLWMAHPYRGIFRISLPAEGDEVRYDLFGPEQGLPSPFNNHLFQLNEQIVFTGETGVFQFDENIQRFTPDKHFEDIFGKNKRVKYLRQDAKGNIWYVVENEVGVLWVKNGALNKKINRTALPELSDRLVGGFEFILPIDDHNVLFATEQGFVHFDPARYEANTPPPTLFLTDVWLKTPSDSLLYGGHRYQGRQGIAPRLNHRQNSISFAFSNTDHEGFGFVLYSLWLEGAEDDWSPWNSDNSIVFSGLQPGDYVFHVRAKGKSGSESPVVSYPFVISPPWYGSQWALVFYGILLVSGILCLIIFQNKKHQKEKAFLENTHQQEQEKKELQVQQSREKINELERQKLEAEVRFKNQELAAATMNLLQKSEMLTAIQTSLERMQKPDGKRDDLFGEINRLLKLVKSETDLSDEWDRFSKHFDQVHSDFLRKLGETHPKLSPNDYKLAAYLRMNLSSKEIASLLNISIRGVEASRYRLRKRLGLTQEENLTDYLMKL